MGINENGFIAKKKLLLILGIAAFAGNGFQIYCSYIANIRFKGWQLYCNYNHVVLGAFLFVLMRIVFEKTNLNRMSWLLSFTDKYTYELYLVHHMLILGPFSLMSVTGILPLNILIILIGSISLALLLKRLEKLLFNL